MKRRWKLIITGAAACLAGLGGVLGLSGCEVAMPVRGPGFDARQGVTLAGAGETVIVAVTHAVLDAKTRGAFDDSTRKVAASLPQQPGFIAYSLRTRLFGDEVWTMTMWVNEEAVDGFTASPVHVRAIRDGMPAVKTAQFLRFEWPSRGAAPSWEEIKRRLASEPVIDYRAAGTHR